MFKSRLTKWLAALLGLVIAFSVVSGIIGKAIQPQNTLLGAVVTPMQKIATGIGDSVNRFIATYNYNKNLEKQNAELRTKLSEATDDLVDFDTYREENEFLRKFLDIKETHYDYKMCDASIIAVDFSDGNYTVTIDRGEISGIGINDPVVTAEGVVGIVTNVQPNFATVSTLLSSDCSIGACATRTGEYGIVTGAPNISRKGMCEIKYLSANTAIQMGDYIVSSGLGGIFPEGLVIGMVDSVSQDSASISSYASVIPSADISNLRRVMVITSFEGKKEIGKE